MVVVPLTPTCAHVVQERAHKHTHAQHKLSRQRSFATTSRQRDGFVTPALTLLRAPTLSLARRAGRGKRGADGSEFQVTLLREGEAFFLRSVSQVCARARSVTAQVGANAGKASLPAPMPHTTTRSCRMSSKISVLDVFSMSFCSLSD
jgi:hypothetical protein